MVRAWDLNRPLLYCPAMNTFMWEHPLTATHIEQLSQFGYVQVPPVSKKLICGDQGVCVCVTIFIRLIIILFLHTAGVGAMAHVEDIVKAVLIAQN